MEEELETVRRCPLCDRLFTLIHIGSKNLAFYVHTTEQLDEQYCPAMGDDQQWVQRCMVALERVNKKRKALGLPVNEDGMPKIFGE